MRAEPGHCIDEPVCQQIDVEPKVSGAALGPLFLGGQKIDQQSAQSARAQLFGNIAVARTESAAPASVREQNHSAGIRRDQEIPFQGHPCRQEFAPSFVTRHNGPSH